MIFPYHSQQGFTLVETLVAITILLIVITGPLTISTSAARSTSFSSEQVVAFFLAQEGAEIMQKARDEQVILRFLPPSDSRYLVDPWAPFADISGTYSLCFLTNGCGLALDTDSVGTIKVPIPCIDQRCALYFDETEGRAKYFHDAPITTPVTPFTRVIKLAPVGNGLKIESIVTWRTGGQREVQEVKVETYLYDIY